MPKKLRTLYLGANGTGRTVVTANTLLRGVLGLEDGATPPRWLQRYHHIANLYAHLRQFYDSLSYVNDWRDALCESSRLDVEICNINNLVQFGQCLLRVRGYDLIVVSHVAAGDDMRIILHAAGALARRACPMLLF